MALEQTVEEPHLSLTELSVPLSPEKSPRFLARPLIIESTDRFLPSYGTPHRAGTTQPPLNTDAATTQALLKLESAEGALLTLDQGWELARAWYFDRLDPSCHGKTAAEIEAILTSIGLTGAYWQPRKA